MVHSCSASSGMTAPQWGHTPALWYSVEHGESVFASSCPSWPSWPPGLLPVGSRSDCVRRAVCAAIDCCEGGTLEFVLSFSTRLPPSFSISASSCLTSFSSLVLSETRRLLTRLSRDTSLLHADSSDSSDEVFSFNALTASTMSVIEVTLSKLMPQS